MKDVPGARNLDEPRFPGGTWRRRLRPWLRALAGTCLAVGMVGTSAMMAGGAATGAHALSFASAPSGLCPKQGAQEFRITKVSTVPGEPRLYPRGVEAGRVSVLRMPAPYKCDPLR
jgi:hypothetical protein